MSPAVSAPKSRLALAAGATLALAVSLGWVAGPARLWSGVLLNDFFFLSLALAGSLFVAIHYLARAGWWVAVRRVPEAMTTFLPVAAVLMLALYFGRRALYSWSRPEAAADALLVKKAAYLNAPFFFLRMAVFVGVWSLFAALMRRASLAQDRGDGIALHRRLGRLSAAFVPVFAVTFALASFDWLMSLEPHWYSTIFGVYCFAGLLLAGIAAITLAVVVLRERGPLAGVVRDEHLHDLGKLLFGFSTFWAYIWVSQYLLIWYTNIPEEATFYAERTAGPWTVPFFAAFALSWVVPFFALLTRRAKRSPRTLTVVAGLVLVGRWLDLWVQIGPPVVGEPHLGLFEILLTAGYAGLFLYLVRAALARAPLVPPRDPFLEESLHGPV